MDKKMVSHMVIGGKSLALDSPEWKEALEQINRNVASAVMKVIDNTDKETLDGHKALIEKNGMICVRLDKNG